MHEFSLLQNIFTILDQIALEKKLKRITKVTLRVGKLRQVVPETMQFAFETLSKSTCAEGAKLVLAFEEIKILCRDCQKEFIVEDNVYLCPACGAASVELISGKELILESVEGEVGGPTRTRT